MLNILDCIRHEVKGKNQIQIHLQNGTTSAHCIHKVNMQHIIFVQNQQASSLVKTGKYFIKSEICNIKILSKAIDKILPGIREELRCASPPSNDTHLQIQQVQKLQAQAKGHKYT